MPIMKIFRTFCIVTRQEADRINTFIKEDNIFQFKADITRRFWQSKDGKGLSVISPVGVSSFKKTKDTIPQMEVRLHAASQDEANRILATIYGGILLAYPDPELSSLSSECHEYKKDLDTHLSKDRYYIGKFSNLANFFFGTLVWHRSKPNKSLIYAIEKYKFSLSLDSITPHSAHPGYGQVFPNYDAQYSYHTRAAFSILAAFSAIEEIQMDIKSSKEKPRWIVKKKGIWNPEVLEDIEERLGKIGIVSTETIDWIFRGKETEVEKHFVPYLGKQAAYNDGEKVRDRILTIPEAIHYASYLRNYIAAHRFSDYTEFISPYDIHNIQNIARRLILSKLGLWQFK